MSCIYFDYAATTPCSDAVLEAMKPYWQEVFGNSNSRSHEFGWKAEDGLEEARKNVAKAINAEPDEIIFTSGATEANNLAIKGFAFGPMINDSKKKIISISTEHKCVIESLRYLRTKGFEIVFLPVDSNGLVDLKELESHLESSSLVSISYVNNETGVIQDMDSISKLCRKYDVVLHTDAVQALGKVPIDARKFDLISLSGHKIYGPKGIGVLFVSKKPRIRLASLFSGGGQERAIRSGTQPVVLCVGFGAACKEAIERMEEENKKAKIFHDLLYNEIVKGVESVYLNGEIDHKIYQTININVPFVEGESLMMRLCDFALASGSACTSKSLEPSHVIKAMHPEDVDLAHSSLRICFGRDTKLEDVEKLIIALKKHIVELRELSPLWSMHKKGIDLKSIKWNAH